MTRFVTSAVAALFLIAPTASPAQTLSCGDWRAEMWETEVGPLWTAFVCTTTGVDRGALLTVQCFGPERGMIRYEDGGNFSADSAAVAFIVDGTVLREEVVYEDMDGALAAYPPLDGPLIASLKAGTDLRVDPGAGFRANDFTLRGSAAAIGQVLTGCAG